MSNHVAVLVLGDLGRSPRMLHHAQALADGGARVELIGYRGRELPAAVSGHPRIDVHAIPAPWRHSAHRSLYLATSLVDSLRDGVQLARVFSGLPALDTILVQNPPAIPSLLWAHIAARQKRARLVVDWHNIAQDMLALRLGKEHHLVKWMGRVEGALGRRGHAHLCVSKGIQRELGRRFEIPDARVFYDRPPEYPSDLTEAERTELFRRLGLGIDPNRSNRPPLIVSASSWSADEDFGLLLETMRLLEEARLECWFLLTGDGPRRTDWEASAARLDLRHVHYRTLWVPADDYLRFLSCADLGISLHRSASGFDLPMKICDMKSAGLPIAALDYGPVLAEFIRPGQNGILFDDAKDLARRIQQVFATFPEISTELAGLRAEVRRERLDGWHAGWLREASEVFA